MGSGKSKSKGKSAVQEEEDNDDGEEMVNGQKNVRAIVKPKIMMKDFSTRLQLNIKLCSIPKPDSFFVVIYSRLSNEQNWIQLGQTESNEGERDLWSFNKTFEVKFSIARHRLLRFEVFKVRDPMFLDDLKYQKFVGCAAASVVEVAMARSKGTGWMVRDLHHPTNGKIGLGKIAVWGEEDWILKQSVSFALSGHNIPSADMWKLRSDAYCVMRRVAPGKNGEEMKPESVFKTEVARTSRNPKWQRIQCPVPQLWPVDIKQDVLMEVKDWFRTTSNKRLGDTWLSYTELQQAFSDSRPLILPIFQQKKKGKRVHKEKIKKKGVRPGKSLSAANMEAKQAMREDPSKKLVAFVQIETVGLERNWSFLDYLRGGLELRLMLGIDFTCSNGDVNDLDSLHTVRGGDAPNAYMDAMKAVTDVLGVYDPDSRFLAYGFGAKIPPSKTVQSQTFALSGDFFDPEIIGLDGLIRAYSRTLRVIKLHGPTQLSPMVRLAANMARPYAQAHSVNDNGVPMAFIATVIFTDGSIDETDKSPLVEELIAAADVPIAIIIVGIGNADFSFLRDLPFEVMQARLASTKKTTQEIETRMVVRFAHFSNCSTPEEQSACAFEALNEIPQEVVGFYRDAGTKPRGLKLHEDEGGKPVDRPENPIGPPPGGKKPVAAPKPFGKGGANRSVTKDSDTASQDSMAEASRAQEEERQRILARLPAYVRERRDAIFKQSLSLGYEKREVNRAFRDGVPSDELEVLVDCLVSCGHNGTHASYKEQLSESVANPLDSVIAKVIPQDAAQLMLEESMRLMNCDRVSLFVHDEKMNILKLYASNMPVTINVSPGQGLVGHVFREGYSLNIPECYKDFRFDRHFDTKTGYMTRSILAVPVVNDGCTVGVIQAINKLPRDVQRDKPDKHLKAVPFSYLDLETLEALSESIGTSLAQGALDNGAIVAAVCHAKALRDMESEITSKMPLETITLLISKLMVALRCDRISIFLFDHSTEMLVLYTSNGSEPIQVPAGKGIAGAVFKEQYQLNIPDVYEDMRFDQKYDLRNSYKTTSILASPIVGGDEESVGVIQAINKLKGDVDMHDEKRYLQACPFNKDDERLISTVARHIGTGMRESSVDVDKIMGIIEMAVNKRRLVKVSAGPPKFNNTLTSMNSHMSYNGSIPGNMTGSMAGTMTIPGAISEDTPGSGRATPSGAMCRFCMQRPADMEFLPCGHRLACAACSPMVPGASCKAGTMCPQCSSLVVEVRQTGPKAGGRPISGMSEASRQGSTLRSNASRADVPSPPNAGAPRPPSATGAPVLRNDRPQSAVRSR
jgi:GAF domain-containing protein